MGTVYRKTVTKALPGDAEIFSRKGKQFARWKDRRGKSQTALLTTGRNGEPRIRLKSSYYYAKYRDADGVVVEVSTGCTNETTARQELANLLRRRELVKTQVITADESAIAGHQTASLADHIAAYVDYLAAKKTHADRTKTTKARLIESAGECGFRRLADLSADKLAGWLVSQEGDGRSASVINGYVEAWVAFGYWCCGKRVKNKKESWNGEKRLTRNPFAGIGRADAKIDRRRQRRALTDDELTRLLDVARRGPMVDAKTRRESLHPGLHQILTSDAFLDLCRRLWTKRPIRRVTVDHAS